MSESGKRPQSGSSIWPGTGRNIPRPDDSDRQDSSSSPSSDVGMRIFASLLAGIVAYGGLGWLADQTLDSKWFMPLGMVIGLVLSVYAIIRKYGSDS